MDKEKDMGKQFIWELFERCSELDAKGYRKLTPDSVLKILEQLGKTS